jgi:pimeloyl-ACP methyl ester carboxylesterase
VQEAVELEIGGKALRGMFHLPAARGMLHEPAEASSGHAAPPLLIIFHGFTGTKVESHFIYPKLCRSLEGQGIASLRFDFSGSGESDGDFRDMTLSGELEEARRIWDFALGLPRIDPESVFILGHSMGGLVAGMLAAEKGPRGLVLIAPAGNMPDIARGYLREKTVAVDARGDHDIGGLVLGRGFLPDLLALDPLGVSREYGGPVCVLQGTADPVVPESVGRQWFSSFPGARSFVPLEGAGHNYDSIAYEERIFSTVGDFISEAALEPVAGRPTSA